MTRAVGRQTLYAKDRFAYMQSPRAAARFFLVEERYDDSSPLKQWVENYWGDGWSYWCWSYEPPQVVVAIPVEMCR